MKFINRQSSLNRHVSRGLMAAMLLLSSQGCAKIKTETREDYIPAGIERQPLSPRYEPHFRATLQGGDDFETAQLLVEATRRKTCRTQVVNLRKKVSYTTNTVGNSAIIWANILLGAGASACAGAQFSDKPCVWETTNEDTGEKEPLSDEARAGWGVGFAAIGTLALTAVIVDLVRATDTTEVLSTEREPVNTEEKACGSEPYPNAAVRIYSPHADEPPYTAHTGADGTVAIPLARLALAQTEPGEPVGRIVVEETELPSDRFPSKWLASKNDYYARQIFGEARATNNAAGYLKYLRAFPGASNAAQAHQSFQTLIMQEDEPYLLVDYLHRFERYDAVRENRPQLEGRLREIRVNRAYDEYVAKWTAALRADAPTLRDKQEALLLNERLFSFHQERIGLAQEEDDAFDTLRTEYKALIGVAPSEPQAQQARDALAGLILGQAGRLQTLADKPDTTHILHLYRESVEWAGTPEVAQNAHQQGFSYAIATLEAELKSTESPDDSSVQFDYLLDEADRHAQSDADRTRVQNARHTLADARSDALLARAEQLAESATQPADPAVTKVFEQAMELAASDKKTGNIRRSYLKYLARSIRLEGDNRKNELTTNFHWADEIMRTGLALAETTREKDLLRRAWIDACAEISAQRAAADQLATLREWRLWLTTAERYADSTAAKKQLKARRRQIERDLHKRYPPSKLHTLAQAAVIYPPTIDQRDAAAMRQALASPKSHRNERLVLGLKITRGVGNKFLAETSEGQLVFIYSSNSYAHSRLRAGQRVGVLATIDGSIPYRQKGKRVFVPQLDIIWAER